MGSELPRRANITTISEACHVSRSKAGAILKAAGLRKDAAGTYLYGKAVATIEELKDPSMAAGNRAAGRAGGASSDAVATLATAKARAEEYRARKLEIECAQKEGRLIDRETVIATGQNVLAHVKSGLLGLPPRVAAKLLNQDTATIARILTEEIEATLTQLADPAAFVNKTLGL